MELWGGQRRTGRRDKGADLLSTQNCRIPTKLSGFKAVSLLRAVAHSYGHVQLIKAYMETSLERNGKASNIRSELQSSGVSIIDTPHNGSKDGAFLLLVGSEEALMRYAQWRTR